MDYETFTKIKKGNYKMQSELIRTHIKRAWFLSYHCTENVCTAAPLLITAWQRSIDEIIDATSPPRSDFKEILFLNIFRLSLEEIEADPDYEDLKAPKVASKYQCFADELQCISDEKRLVYLISTYGGVSDVHIGEVLGIGKEDVMRIVRTASSEIPKKSQGSGNQWAENIRLSTEFRNPTGSGFAEVEIPQTLLNALEHSINTYSQKTLPKNRKETFDMASKTVTQTKGGTNTASKTPSRKKGSSKRTKIIVWSAVGLALVILGVIFLPKLFSKKNALTSVTTYNVEAISYGNVDTTISGSGTLSPVSKETLTNAKPVTVTAVNYGVGDTVEEDAVIATAKDSDGNSYDFTAPYQCVLLELPIAVDDELAANSEIAMIMGTDGFTMGIAVDETNISTVAIGQEVSFTIDAVSGDYTGSVTAISYNGSSSGGSVAYQITATVDYIEGVYPGMSASAKIVIESSGEGLLVPVDAVRTSGDDSYVYLAPSGSTAGTEYAEDELTLSSLTKVTVETGMSDGSYMLIKSDKLSEGDLIVITKLTSTLTGSDSDQNGGMGGMGGFPGGGGGFPGGMNFEDFDFENFDPSNMPQGGGFPGGRQ